MFNRLLLIIALLAGAQLIQYSPVHAHAHELAHVIDCDICHFQDHNPGLDSPPTALPRASAAQASHLQLRPATTRSGYSLYQSRAPPLFT